MPDHLLPTLLTFAYIVLASGAALLLCGFVFERIAFSRDRRTYSRRGQTIDVGGYRLNVLRMGSRSPTVVIAPGGGQPAIDWEPVQRAVAEFTSAWCYDRSYIGWSGDDGARCTVQGRVAELRRLLAKIALKGPLVLVGHSYSGFMVREYARRYPDEVGALVLVDCTEEEFITRPEFLPMWKVARWPVIWRVLAGAFGGMKVWVAFRPIEAALPAGFTPQARAEHKAIVSHERFWMGTLREVGSLMDPRERQFLRDRGGPGTLGDLPMIVLAAGLPPPQEAPQFKAAGAMSWELFTRLQMESQERLAKLSSASEFIVAKKSGHSINFFEPELIVESVRRVVEVARQRNRSMQGRDG